MIGMKSGVNDASMAVRVIEKGVYSSYTPMNRLFGSAPMGSTEWMWVLSGGLAIYAVVGIEKWLRCCADREKGE